MDPKNSKNSTDLNENLVNVDKEEQYLSDGCRLWNTLVRQYTDRSLTQPKDKLIAISGVARYIERMLPQSVPEDKFGYLAGLWGQFLPTQLLWSVRSNQSTKTKEYRAPSVSINKLT